MSSSQPKRIFGLTYLEVGIVAVLVGVICVLAGGLLVFLLLRTQPAPSQAIAPSQVSAQVTATSIVPAGSTGKWKVSKSTSEFDNSTTVALSLDAEKPIQAWLTVTLPVLVLRCQEGKMDVYVNVGTQSNVEYGRIDMATVRVRFDQNPAFQVVTNESTDGEALFFMAPYDMIMAMLRSREMVFGFTPFNADPVVTAFDLRGLSSVIDPLKQSCNWNGQRPTMIPLPTLMPQPTATSTATPLPSGSALTISSDRGDWKVEVEKIEVVPSVSMYGDTYKAKGRYALLFLRVTNVGQYPESFIGFGNIQIKDAQGVTYDEDTIASVPAATTYNVPFGTRIQPDETTERLVSFDLPFDSAAYYLVPGLLAENNGQSILLDLPK